MVYNDPYFEKQNAKAISKTTDPADVLRIIFICLCVVLGIIIALVALIALVAMRNRGKTYTERIKIILATIDVFSLKHYTKIGFPVLNKSTPYGGVVTLMFIIVAVTIFAFSILDAVNDLNVIEIGTVLPKESIGVDTVKGKYALRLALQNFGDSNCTLNSKDIIATNFEGSFTYSSILLSNSTCIVEFICASCYLSGTTQRIEFMFGQRFAAASAIDYTLSIPYFDTLVKELNITERVVPANAQENMFKGAKPTEISLSLTTTKYLQISTVDYFFYNLVSKITKATFSTTSIGYSATRNPTTLGSTVHYTNFWSDQTTNGLSITFSLLSNPNAYYIQQQGKTTILGYFSTLFSLLAAAFSLLAVTMNLSEKIHFLIQQRHKQAQIAKQASMLFKETEMQQTTTNNVVADVPPPQVNHVVAE